MNPPDSETEDLLRTLRPAPPRASLEERIGAALSSRPVVVRPAMPAAALLRRGESARVPWWQGWGWALAGAAAAAVAIAGIEHFTPERASAPVAAAETGTPGALEYVDSSAEIVATEDDGLVITDEAEPVHRVRFTSYERHVWTNPTTGALMEYTVPREDIRLTPIALQ